MPFLGGRVWLDLINSRFSLDGVDYDAFAADGSAAQWLADAEIGEGSQEPDGFQRVRGIRDALAAALAPLLAGQAVPEATVAAVNAALSGLTIHYRLEPGPSGLRLVEQVETGCCGAAGILARDFARFVCDHDPRRLRRCANPACTLVFYDAGKNNIRRWCTMSICGNRDKVARYRARKSASGA